MSKNEQLRNEAIGLSEDLRTAKYKPVIIVGPSGVGKGTLIDHLFSLYPHSFKFSVSFTTRKAREGEVNGVHYNFVTKEQFQEMIDKDDFIEWCWVHENMYGTAKSQIRSI